MAVTVLETLSAEDLERWRHVAADIDAARAEGASFDDWDMLRAVFLHYYGLYGELLRAYGVEGAEADEAKISPFTGNIYVGSEG